MPTASVSAFTPAPALLALSALAIALRPPVSAQPGVWPYRPARIIVAFPPGGSIDTVARLTGQRLADALGQPFVVDNRAGAAGIIGTDAVVRAAPDGYTLLMGSASAISSAPSVYAKLPCDPLRGWIGLLAPSASPREIVLRINAEVHKMLSGDLRARLFELGLDVAGGSPESFGAFTKADIARDASIVKAARIPSQ